MTDLFSGLSPTRRILKVHQLTAEIRGLLEESFSDFWIEGEISEPRMPRSGHLYFTLKDQGSRIKGIIFKSHMRFLRFVPKEGNAVLIRAHLSLYEPRGEYQLICDYIEPMGAGALFAAFEALKQKLEHQGLFRIERKQVIPSLPCRIGIITSPSGAAIQDILKVLREGKFPSQILLYPVTVQGGNAAPEIVQALETLNRHSEQSPANALDLLILTRGGGSIEDFAPFNSEVVALAISSSQIPVISAVGHETDTTISDYVADLRAPTPSIAAEMVLQIGLASIEKVFSLQAALLDRIQEILGEKQSRVDVLLRLLSPPQELRLTAEKVKHLSIQLEQAMARIIESKKNRFATAEQTLSHLNLIDRLCELGQVHKNLDKRLVQEGRRSIEHEKIRLQTAMEQLNLLSPLNILGRGYSIARSLPSLDVVRDVADVSKGDRLQILLNRGQVTCSVEDTSLRQGL